MELEQIAQLCHEANRTWCKMNGDMSQVPWRDAPDWQRSSAIDGVMAIRDGVVKKPEDSHNRWMEHKIAEGWTHGEVKDPDAKTHPALVPFKKLPTEQQVKDKIFFAIARALTR